ncbi:hypothetical protein RCL_jg14116.t1 [Rhizophagus clarus]|uniref:Uncharacterized protein n=1 Tax=Rhizophagus clarus TaxID=94130 RepID=A0A8H3M005_9GLOM|nr:hypothetical protein RCL_jg14116.t1 [Rhizophagus clarus]
MDLDWCLICERKTNGTLYCSEELLLVLQRQLIAPSPCFQRPQQPPITNTNNDHLKNDMNICVFLPEIKKSQSALNQLNPAFKNTIEMQKDSNANLSCSLDTRQIHI